MNFGFKSFNGILSVFSQFRHTPVRHRYYAEKLAKGPIAKKFGYKDKLFKGGLLPRLKDAKRLPLPLYRPGNPWTHEKCTFGQNDYIDLLGGGKLKPHDVCYDVPHWLRGKRGNEMQLLLLKKNVFSYTKYEYENPKAWDNLNKRIRHLYKYLNRKTKTDFMRD